MLKNRTILVKLLHAQGHNCAEPNAYQLRLLGLRGKLSKHTTRDIFLIIPPSVLQMSTKRILVLRPRSMIRDALAHGSSLFVCLSAMDPSQEKLPFRFRRGARAVLFAACSCSCRRAGRSVSSGLNLVTDGWFVLLALLCVAFVPCCCRSSECYGLLLPLFGCVGIYGSLSLMECYPFLQQQSQDWIRSCVYMLSKMDLSKVTSFLFNS